MIALLATLPGRSIFTGTMVRARVRFVDEETDADQTPASVDFTIRTPGGDETTYTWTAPSTAPTLDARLVGFSKTATASLVIFEAQIAIVDDDAAGTYAIGWTAKNGAGVALVSQWGAVSVEPKANRADQPLPIPAPAPPYDTIGADVWAYGYPAGSFYQ